MAMVWPIFPRCFEFGLLAMANVRFVFYLKMRLTSGCKTTHDLMNSYVLVARDLCYNFFYFFFLVRYATRCLSCDGFPVVSRSVEKDNPNSCTCS